MCAAIGGQVDGVEVLGDREHLIDIVPIRLTNPKHADRAAPYHGGLDSLSGSARREPRAEVSRARRHGRVGEPRREARRQPLDRELRRLDDPDPALVRGLAARVLGVDPVEDLRAAPRRSPS